MHFFATKEYLFWKKLQTRMCEQGGNTYTNRKNFRVLSVKLWEMAMTKYRNIGWNETQKKFDWYKDQDDGIFSEPANYRIIGNNEMTMTEVKNG